jgi:hypothetical protein
MQKMKCCEYDIRLPVLVAAIIQSHNQDEGGSGLFATMVINKRLVNINN